MAQQSKQKKVGACKGFACHSVTNGDDIHDEVVPKTFSLIGKALYSFDILQSKH
jgi:hypothetical protein